MVEPAEQLADELRAEGIRQPLLCCLYLHEASDAEAEAGARQSPSPDPEAACDLLEEPAAKSDLERGIK
jgi:hypothetical protein